MNDLDAQFQEQLERLRARIAASPRRSWTAQECRDLIDYLTSPSCPLDGGERLAAVTKANRDFERGLQITDASHRHPGDRPRDE